MADKLTGSQVLEYSQNYDDVVKKYHEEEERRKQIMRERGLDPEDVKAAGERAKRRTGSFKEETVSPEVIINPQDATIKEVTKAVLAEGKKIDQITEEMTKERPSLKGRVKKGEVKKEVGV